MPADSSDSTATPDQSLSPVQPEQYERRARAWARSYRWFRIVLGSDALVILAAGAFLLAFGTGAFKPMVPIVCGFLIFSIVLFLSLLTLLVRNGPIWTTTLQGVRVLMTLGSVYALLLAVIDLLLLLLFWSVGFVRVRVNVLGAYGIFVLLAFFLFGLAVAFIVALIERVSQQVKN